MFSQETTEDVNIPEKDLEKDPATPVDERVCTELHLASGYLPDISTGTCIKHLGRWK